MHAVPGQSLTNAFEDLKADMEQLARADWSHSSSMLQRVVAHFAEGTRLGNFVSSTLPAVDFSAWIENARKTGGAVAGSGRLDWPHNRAERVAMQLATLRCHG
jgi:hypothetical protein